MAILYRIYSDGSLLVGDTETGATGFAYADCPTAEMAREGGDFARQAAEALLRNNWWPPTDASAEVKAWVRDRSAAWIAELNQYGNLA